MSRDRLAGHTLRFEGAPHAVNQAGDLVRVGYGGVSGYGRGVCSCGAMSGLVDSGTQRRQWHREHKAAERASA